MPSTYSTGHHRGTWYREQFSTGPQRFVGSSGCRLDLSPGAMIQQNVTIYVSSDCEAGSTIPNHGIVVLLSTEDAVMPLEAPYKGAYVKICMPGHVDSTEAGYTFRCGTTTINLNSSFHQVVCTTCKKAASNVGRWLDLVGGDSANWYIAGYGPQSTDVKMFLISTTTG